MNASDRRLADLADKAEGRYHEVGVKYADRIVASEGARGRAWLKFNPGKRLVYAENPEGQMFGLTPVQVSLLSECGQEWSGTMRALAQTLGVAPSTISRALVKLASFGLIAALTGRGRYAGTVVIRRLRDDGLNRFREAARAKAKGWYQKADERVSRLKFNVASRYSVKEIEDHGYLHTYLVVIGATLKAEWSAEDVAGVV